MNSIEAAFVGAILGDAIELKTSKAGKPWASFSVRVGDGDDAQFVRVSVFGELAQRMAKAGSLKGAKVYVEAYGAKINQYQDKTGAQRVGLQCAATKVERVGSTAIGRNKPKRDNNGDAREPEQQPQQSSSSQPIGDEIPF